MLLSIAKGGSEGTSPFSNAIVVVPCLPMHWAYDGDEPTQAKPLWFDCLIGADTLTLQNASAHVSAPYKYGGSVGGCPCNGREPAAQKVLGAVKGRKGQWPADIGKCVSKSSSARSPSYLP